MYLKMALEMLQNEFKLQWIQTSTEREKKQSYTYTLNDINVSDFNMYHEPREKNVETILWFGFPIFGPNTDFFFLFLDTNCVERNTRLSTDFSVWSKSVTSFVFALNVVHPFRFCIMMHFSISIRCLCNFIYLFFVILVIDFIQFIVKPNMKILPPKQYTLKS